MKRNTCSILQAESSNSSSGEAPAQRPAAVAPPKKKGKKALNAAIAARKSAEPAQYDNREADLSAFKSQANNLPAAVASSPPPAETPPQTSEAGKASCHCCPLLDRVLSHCVSPVNSIPYCMKPSHLTKEASPCTSAFKAHDKAKQVQAPLCAALLCKCIWRCQDCVEWHFAVCLQAPSLPESAEDDVDWEEKKIDTPRAAAPVDKEASSTKQYALAALISLQGLADTRFFPGHYGNAATPASS